MYDISSKIESRSRIINIPKLQNSSSGSSYAGGNTSFQIDVTGYTKLTIGTVYMPMGGNGGTTISISTNVQGTLISKNVKTDTTLSNLSYDITGSTTLTIGMHVGANNTSPVGYFANIVIS